ncbi:MAG: ligase-associated DNA damage response exonuclease [Saprospirales bacterium]|nr:MAG: ligase-associated DNA damage response exonuclease [Saprospirales bacterium]
MTDLIIKDENGLYVPKADVYLDPWRKVDKAIISHMHADHCRYGHKQYIIPNGSLKVFKKRIGPASVSTRNFREPFSINGVKFSFHPAGHIPGSAQIRVESGGEVWVYSGDYKTEEDGLAESFEPVTCHTFITECTFGLPVYLWKPQSQVFEEILDWWTENQSQSRPSVILAYSLGKAQRLISGLSGGPGPIYCHSAAQQMTNAVRRDGFDLKRTKPLTEKTPTEMLNRSLVIISPSGFSNHFVKKFKDASTAAASGWMSIRGARRRRGVDRGFTLSDHADWGGLLLAVKATRAERVLCTHGYQHIFAQYLRELGLQAEELRIDDFTDEG